jgi:hypothetical protein
MIYPGLARLESRPDTLQGAKNSIKTASFDADLRPLHRVFQASTAIS